MKKETNKQPKQVLVEGSPEALQAEINRLHMENEYLKKLNALVQAKEDTFFASFFSAAFFTASNTSYYFTIFSYFSVVARFINFFKRSSIVVPPSKMSL